MAVKVQIVEDDFIIATDIKQMLVTAGFQVTGIANNYAKGMRQFKKSIPDLIICDIFLGEDKTGIDFVKNSRKTKIVPVIYLTGLSDDATVEEALETSPDSYLTKPFSEHQLLVSVRRILNSSGQSELLKGKIPKPSKREQEIIRCIANGFSSREIAELLGLSFETIQTHRKRIFKKLHVHSSAEMVTLSLRKRWLT